MLKAMEPCWWKLVQRQLQILLHYSWRSVSAMPSTITRFHSVSQMFAETKMYFVQTPVL